MTEVEQQDKKKRTQPSGGGGDALYAIGIAGAGVYFWQHAESGREKALAVLKAFVWPAFLVHRAFTLLEVQSNASIRGSRWRR